MILSRPPFRNGLSDFAQTGLYRSVITNVEKSINSSDQIPAEFGAIPDKREGGQNLPPPPDLLGLTINQPQP